MLTTSSLTLTSAAAWPRTHTSISLSSFSSLVMNPSVLQATRSSSISTTLARSLSGLFSLMLMSTTAPRSSRTPTLTWPSAPSLSTTPMPSMLSCHPLVHLQVTIPYKAKQALLSHLLVCSRTLERTHSDVGSQWGEAVAGGASCSVPALSVPFPISDHGDSGVSDAGAFVLAECALNKHCWGQNPVVTAKLQLNGQDRFSEREGTYFDLVQPYQHHTRSPDTGINVYSFALRPEEHQPSGTCNMSRIDNATLQLVLSTNAIGGDNTAKVRVYATNYNVLRIMSGMGGLAYSN